MKINGVAKYFRVPGITSKGDNCFDNQHYANIRRLLIIVGSWPYLELSKRLPYISLITILMVTGICAQIYMLMSEQKSGSINEILQTFLPNILSGFTYWNLLYNSTLMKKTFDHLKKDWNEVTCDHELNIIQRYTAQSKQYSQALAYAFCFYVTFLIFPSLLRIFLYTFGLVNESEFILPVHHVVLAPNNLIYSITYPLELMIIVTTCIIGITHYSLFISLIQHACALLVIVTNTINRPFVKNEYKFCWTKTGSKQEAELEWIVTIVKNYNNAIGFIELITSLYGKIYILDVSTMFCVFIIDFIYIFQLLSLTMNGLETLKIFLYLNGSVLLIYAYLHIGERLMEHSIGVYAKCRMVPFYTLSVRTNKLFLLFIVRSMKPCNISIGGTAVSSHELLAKMMRATFSFATVCYNVR